MGDIVKIEKIIMGGAESHLQSVSIYYTEDISEGKLITKGKKNMVK